MKPERIQGWLPEVFQQTVRESNPMAAVLEVMSALVTPIEEHLDALDATFNAYRTRRSFVPYLAQWVDMDRIIDASAVDEFSGEPGSGTERLREMVARGAVFARLRGTAEGLRLYLETATGVPGFVVSESPGRRPFHIRIDAPAEAGSHRALIARIVALEKPAYVTAAICYVGAAASHA